MLISHPKPHHRNDCTAMKDLKNPMTSYVSTSVTAKTHPSLSSGILQISSTVSSGLCPIARKPLQRRLFEQKIILNILTNIKKFNRFIGVFDTRKAVELSFITEISPFFQATVNNSQSYCIHLKLNSHQLSKNGQINPYLSQDHSEKLNKIIIIIILNPFIMKNINKSVNKYAKLLKKIITCSILVQKQQKRHIIITALVTLANSQVTDKQQMFPEQKL